MASLKYWVWLSCERSFSSAGRAGVIAYFGDPETAYNAPDSELAYAAHIKTDRSSQIKSKNLSYAEHIISVCEKQNISIITMQDAAYPKSLKMIAAPPPVLYVRGKLPETDGNVTVAVFGTRHASDYGLNLAGRISAEICMCGGIVICGCTAGIDSAAARAAADAKGTCILVLGTPHPDVPSELEKRILERGAVISEYPPETFVQKSFFRERNRITAGLAIAAAAIEAPLKSGTMLFAAEAAEQGKDVYAVPGNVDSETSMGTNELIRNGATAISCGWDIMSEYEMRYPGKVHRAKAQPAEPEKTVPEAHGEDSVPSKEIDNAETEAYIDLKAQLAELPQAQLQIMCAIEKNGTHIDEIIEHTGLPTAAVMSNLTILRVKGYIRQLPGNRVSLNTAKK